MNDKWNYNMDEAPRGKYVTKTLKVGIRQVETEMYEHDLIIATDGDIVTLSKWLPPITDGPVSKQRDGRWMMFGLKQTPLAWQPWPKSPNAINMEKDQ